MYSASVTYCNVARCKVWASAGLAKVRLRVCSHQYVEASGLQQCDLVCDGEGGESRQLLGKLHRLYDALGGELAELIPQIHIQCHAPSELLLYTQRETKFSYGKCLITASIKAERVAHELWLSALVKSACKQKQNQRTVLGVIDKQAHICNYSIDSSFSVSSLFKNQYRAKTARSYPHRSRFYWLWRSQHVTYV